MSEIKKLREAVYDLATSDDLVLDDEEWYDRLWELLDPVIDARRTAAEAPSPRGSMTFAEAEALLVEYQREKLTKQRERS